MQSNFGWTLLSRKDVRQASLAMTSENKGVLDELGLLEIHAGYADRFFPGTSVLQTRLRYCLFVAWIYDDLLRNGTNLRAAKAVEQAELLVTKRLKQNPTTGDGIIGGRIYPEYSVQPASFIYWSNLSTWGLLYPRQDGTTFSRSAVHDVIDRRPPFSGRVRLDDDGQSLSESPSLFVSLPDSPLSKKAAAQNQTLTFELSADERAFLRRHITALKPVCTYPQPQTVVDRKSLLAHLVERYFIPGVTTTAPWSSDILREVTSSQEKAGLQRARQAASLGLICRAIYLALVETMREQDDGLPTPDRHRRKLREISDRDRQLALALKVQDLPTDIGQVSNALQHLLTQTQQWLASGSADPRDLLEEYARVEQDKKQDRAKLSKLSLGRGLRAAWKSEEREMANPLHYRFARARTFLQDIAGIDST